MGLSCLSDGVRPHGGRQSGWARGRAPWLAEAPKLPARQGMGPVAGAAPGRLGARMRKRPESGPCRAAGRPVRQPVRQAARQVGSAIWHACCYARTHAREAVRLLVGLSLDKQVSREGRFSGRLHRCRLGASGAVAGTPASAPEVIPGSCRITGGE